MAASWYTYLVDGFTATDKKLLEDCVTWEQALRAAHDAVAEKRFKRVEIWCKETDCMVWEQDVYFDVRPKPQEDWPEGMLRPEEIAEALEYRPEREYTVEVQFDVTAWNVEDARAECAEKVKGLDCRITAVFDADGERVDAGA